MDAITELIEADDAAGLLRLVDTLCNTRDWDELVRVADLCRQAIDRGRQLWPVAMHIEYRLALEGPAEYAAAVLESGASRFTLGPLTEVAASTHSWAELVVHLPARHVAAVVAQERILRGEDLTRETAAAAEIFDLPLRLVESQAGYPLPTYGAHGAEFPDPDPPAGPIEAHEGVSRSSRPDPGRADAWRDLLEVWLTESNGVCHTATVDTCDPRAAIGGLADTWRAARIDPGEALARMTWSAASGGGAGRRRGGAAGRFQAWWCAARVAGLDWPPGDDFLARLDELDWLWWEPVPRPPGWLLCLAICDPAAGWSNAVLAVDTITAEEGGRPAMPGETTSPASPHGREVGEVDPA